MVSITDQEYEVRVPGLVWGYAKGKNECRLVGNRRDSIRWVVGLFVFWPRAASLRALNARQLPELFIVRQKVSSRAN